jgi:E3 ubiquitin-protein ligase BRE1
MSESLKAKQLQTSLQAEKQVLASRMQHAHAAVDVYKQRVTRLEEQVCFLDFEPISMCNSQLRKNSAMMCWSSH